MECQAGLPVLHSSFLLVIYLTHDGIYMSMLPSQFVLPSLSPDVSILYICISIPSLQVGSSIQFSIFHIYALTYDIYFSLFDLLHFTLYDSSRSIHIYKWLSFVPFNGWVPFNIPLCDSITLKRFYLGFFQLPRKLLTSTHIHSRQET